MRRGQFDPDHIVDTLVVPEALARRVTALTDATPVVCGFGDAVVAISGEAGSTPPWIG